MARSLILTSSYEPVRVISWQKAIVLWLQDKVEVLEFHTISIHSARQQWPLPSVIRLRRYIPPRVSMRLRYSRENVLKRDRHTCQYCGDRFGAKELTLDHVVPASRGGNRSWDNIVTACYPCNHKKGNKTPKEVNMKLLRPPGSPKWLPADQILVRIETIHDTWKAYLV